MTSKSIMIVDDEKNIRVTLSQALQPLGWETHAAASGEEALAKLGEREFYLILLDLKMPGIDGMELLRRVRALRKDVRVIIITAYGTVESAVEAMKLGAVDFIQKPFSAHDIRELVVQVVNREELSGDGAADYNAYFQLAKKSMADQGFDRAIEYVQKAIAVDPSRADAFNLLGVLWEIQGDRLKALKYYRAAISLEPTHEAASRNLERNTRWPYRGTIFIEEQAEGNAQGKEHLRGEGADA
jgi:FixJ family two-component response regulator